MLRHAEVQILFTPPILLFILYYPHLYLNSIKLIISKAERDPISLFCYKTKNMVYYFLWYKNTTVFPFLTGVDFIYILLSLEIKNNLDLFLKRCIIKVVITMETLRFEYNKCKDIVFLYAFFIV